MRSTTTKSPQETVSFARSFADTLCRGDVVALYGNLGTGKTRFVKGVCEAFGVREHITSPTFVILNRYEGLDRSGRELFLYHFDLYRVRSLSEVYDLGYEEFLGGEGICLIEWAETLENLLPTPRYDVTLAFGVDENERRVDIAQVEAGGKKVHHTSQTSILS